MKEKISISIDAELYEHIKKEMVRHQQNNFSKFIEFILNQVLYSPQKKLLLLERQREYALSKFKILNEDILKLQEYIKKLEEAEKIIEEKKQEKKDDKEEKDNICKK